MRSQEQRAGKKTYLRSSPCPCLTCQLATPTAHTPPPCHMLSANEDLQIDPDDFFCPCDPVTQVRCRVCFLRRKLSTRKSKTLGIFPSVQHTRTHAHTYTHTWTCTRCVVVLWSVHSVLPSLTVVISEPRENFTKASGAWRGGGGRVYRTCSPCVVRLIFPFSAGLVRIDCDRPVFLPLSPCVSP